MDSIDFLWLPAASNRSQISAFTHCWVHLWTSELKSLSSLCVTMTTTWLRTAWHQCDGVQPPVRWWGYLGPEDACGRNELLRPPAELLFPWRLKGKKMSGALFLPGSWEIRFNTGGDRWTQIYVGSWSPSPSEEHSPTFTAACLQYLILVRQHASSVPCSRAKPRESLCKDMLIQLYVSSSWSFQVPGVV